MSIILEEDTSSSGLSIEEILGNFVSFDFEWNEDDIITAAAFVDSEGRSEVYLREWYSSETDFLLDIVVYLTDYQVSIGWYTTGTVKYKDGVDSDLIHLHNRCIANDIDSIVGFRQNHQPYIHNQIHIDLHEVFDKKIIKESVFRNGYRTLKLNAVAKFLLKIGKYNNLTGADFESLSIEDEKKQYVLRDAELVSQLVKYDNFKVLGLMLAVAQLCAIEFDRVCRSNLTTWWKIIYDRLIEDGNCGKPTKIFKQSDEEEDIVVEGGQDESIVATKEEYDRATSQAESRYRGGEVFKPKKGLYEKFLLVLDAKSLYPSVAILYNLSFDTVNCSCCCETNPSCKITEPEVLKDCKFGQDYWICNKRDGATRQMFTIFREERFRQKKLGNDAKQTVIKILMNAAYGVFANKYFAYFDPRVAELITAYGRFTLLKMGELAESMGFPVIYGDTDSVFVFLNVSSTDNNGKDTLQIAKDTAVKFQNLVKERIGVEVETKRIYYRCAISAGAKHYVGYGIDEDGEEKFDIIGMEAKKFDRPEFIHKVFKEIATGIIKTAYIENRFFQETIPLVKTTMQELNAGKIEPEMLLRKQVLGKELKEYKSQGSRICKIGRALGLGKGDQAEWYDSDTKEGWSTNPADISISKYKKLFWNCIQELFEITGYPVDELAEEFSVKVKRKTTRTVIKRRRDKDGHSDAEKTSSKKVWLGNAN